MSRRTAARSGGSPATTTATTSAAGNLVIAQAYSGDVASCNRTTPTCSSSSPSGRHDVWSDNMVMPNTTKNRTGAEEWMNYVYDPVNCRRGSRPTCSTSRRSRASGEELASDRPGAGRQPADQPARGYRDSWRLAGALPTRRTRSSTPPTPRSPRRVTDGGHRRQRSRRSRFAPYLLSLPALAYLAVFFVVPLFALARTSLSPSGGSVYHPTLSSPGSSATTRRRSDATTTRSSGRSGTR